ncbi:hypothetical protein KC357_g291 [Hortaea werneckii]|nr:hypothetical protein KC357_g291 [Hortaea werneckii]
MLTTTQPPKRPQPAHEPIPDQKPQDLHIRAPMHLHHLRQRRQPWELPTIDARQLDNVRVRRVGTGSIKEVAGKLKDCGQREGEVCSVLLEGFARVRAEGCLCLGGAVVHRAGSGHCDGRLPTFPSQPTESQPLRPQISGPALACFALAFAAKIFLLSAVT